MKKIKLNIGAGLTYIPDFINIDISERADLTLDLNEERLPFDSDSVDLVFSYHTLEHVDNYLFALGEIYRVLKHGGIFLLGVPYVTLTEYHLVNPYHRQNFNEFAFDFFDPVKLKGSASEVNSILFTKAFHRFHYIRFFNLLPFPLRGWCRYHLFNVVRKIDYGLVAIKDPNNLISISHTYQSQLRQEFQTCLKQRVAYEKNAKDNQHSRKSEWLRQRNAGLFLWLANKYRWWNGTSN